MFKTNPSSNRQFYNQLLSPRDYKYAINRSEKAVVYALSSINDYNDNKQVRQALDLVHNTAERLTLVERMVKQKNIQKQKEEMDRINHLRPILEKVKNKFFMLVKVSKQKSYGIDTRDFEKFGMRQTQAKMNFLMLMQLAKLAKEEKIDFNDELDEEYCDHRKLTRGDSLVKLDKIGRRNLNHRTVINHDYQYFLKKRSDESEPMTSLKLIYTPKDSSHSSPDRKKSFAQLSSHKKLVPSQSPEKSTPLPQIMEKQMIPQIMEKQMTISIFDKFASLHQASNRQKQKISDNIQLTFLTKAHESFHNIIPQRKLITLPELSSPKKKKVNYTNTMSKVASHRIKISPNNALILGLHRNKLKPSALYEFLSNQDFDDGDNAIKF